MSSAYEVVIRNNPIREAEINGVLAVFWIEVLRSIRAGECVIVRDGDVSAMRTRSLSGLGPALKVLSSWKRPTRIQQKVADDADRVASMHLNVGFAVGDDVSLNYKVGWFVGENSIIVITASRAQGFGMNVAVKNVNPITPGYEHAVPAAGADLGILDGDVPGIDNPNAITTARGNFQPLDDGSIAAVDDNRA